MAGDTNNQKRREFILKAARLSGAIGLCFAVPQVLAGDTAQVKNAKISSDKNSAKLLFMLDKPVVHKVFTLKAPDRVVVDFSNTQADKLSLQGKKGRNFKGLRYAQRNQNDLRVVLDLDKPAEVKTSQQGNQLELTLNFSARAGARPPAKATPAPKQKQSPAPVVPVAPARGDFIVAIDAGHGGKDPGAVGARGTLEKDVVLQIAKKLKARIEREPGMKAVMVREGDYYIPLRKRMQIARRKHADLFVSIHADANRHRTLKGSSVYILSENGASSEAARWLAQSENSYESNLGGASLSQDSTLNSMLMDLSQAATIDNSLNLAKRTLRELGQVNRLLHKRVESAAFVVLKSPDIPSMLVETAFISNPSEEKRLRTGAYQSKLADAMFRGIRGYKLTHAPGGRLRNYANSGRRHVVQPGESISKIAREYGVSSASLRSSNNINGSLIKVGQKLTIPTRS